MAHNYTLSDNGRQFIEHEEGERSTAYQDSVGVWTIGYGHTGDVRPGETISQEEADQLLAGDTAWAVKAVNAGLTVEATQNQFDAMVSLTFNIGSHAFSSSTVLKDINNGDIAGAADAFLLWKNAGGQPVLLGRRTRERALFLTA